MVKIKEFEKSGGYVPCPLHLPPMVAWYEGFEGLRRYLSRGPGGRRPPGMRFIYLGWGGAPTCFNLRPRGNALSNLII